MVTILVLVGLIFNSLWLVGIGLIGLFFVMVSHYSRVRETPIPAAAPSGGVSHKVLQAPMGAWDEDPTLTALVALGGQRTLTIGPPDDTMRAVSASSKNPIARDVVRNRLPFTNYGRESLFEHFFIGLPINMGTLIKKR